ncbi:hypothetical protein N7526_001301 [Penicillium atrosanguineum]|nr:hypothetical protein N7526_001301 [Penicillium atrosanguineum]
METDSTAAKLPAKRAELNVENEEASTPSSPLDAGENVRGFLQVLGVFLIIFNVWGLTFAYGSFESFYALTYIPTFSASAIAWIGTIQSWLLIVSGLISGPLFDRGYFSIMIGAGAFLAVFGFMMLSLSHDYYAIFLSQGVCMGLGFGLLYIPSIALISRSFVRKRAVALGFATSGAPAGGIIYTVMFDQLISKLSFAWTVRIMAFLMLSLFLVAAFLLRVQLSVVLAPPSVPTTLGRWCLGYAVAYSPEFYALPGSVQILWFDLFFLRPFMGYLWCPDSTPTKCILSRLSRRTDSWHLAWNGSKYQQLRITLGATDCRCARFGWLS